MPVFVKAHTRAGHQIKGYTRSATIVKKANMLRYNLSSITARGMFLSKPQRKAFHKAGNLEFKHSRLIGTDRFSDRASLKQHIHNEGMRRERY